MKTTKPKRLKPRQVNVAMTESQMRKLAWLAKHTTRTASDLIRALIEEAYRESKTPIPKDLLEWKP